MQGNIGLYSYGAASVAYAILAIAMLFFWRTKRLSLSALLATVMTACWAGIVSAATLLPYPPVALLQAVEIVRNAAWLFLLLAIYGARLSGTNHVLGSRRWIPWYMVGLSLMIVVVFSSPMLGRLAGIPEVFLQAIVYAIWLSMSLVGLLLLENLYRNSSVEERWWVKYLVFGLGFVFAYDFFMYAGALLLQQLDPALWRSRGFAVIISAPLIAIAAARSRDIRTAAKLSRHVVFHTFTLLAAGVYLIFMAIVGYFVSYLGGTWSGVLQITFLSAAGLFLVVLLASTRLRARSRVWLSKNFFSYKYDYRLEWLEFTATLAEGGFSTPRAIIRAMSKLAGGRAGLLWANSEAGGVQLIDEWQTKAIQEEGSFTAFYNWLRETGWIIDTLEWRENPEVYQGLTLPQSLAQAPGAWLVIPLVFENRLEGILVLQRTGSLSRLNWEDRDLLKVAGRQAAIHLAQFQSSQALMELRQFEAFNRMSAYVVHDLKNILAEQSLIVSNAPWHRDNPAFFDDVIDTISDSIERMTHLMEQMRTGMRGGEFSSLVLDELLKGVVDGSSRNPPCPTLKVEDSDIWVRADGGQLSTVFNHIIQNAKEATNKHGNVDIRLYRDGDMAVVEVKDDGVGMSQEFIKERLFTPFDSTKGLTGMGIGVFESREVLKGLGGAIKVESEEGLGSCFRIVVPCVRPE